jgi:hypothetical protein
MQVRFLLGTHCESSYLFAENDYMEPHLLSRPKKALFKQSKVNQLIVKAVQGMQNLLLPNEGISKILLIGSSVKKTFGKYEEPGFRGSLYSDFDFIAFVKDAYEIPESLSKQPDAKPFLKNEWNLAYRIKNFVEDKYDAEIFFIRESSLNEQGFMVQAELAGIPLSEISAHKFKIVYPSKVL